jgi:hypothetical protein
MFFSANHSMVEASSPFWTRYSPGYINKDFAFYDREPVELGPNTVSGVNLAYINRFKEMGDYDGLVNKNLVRRDWGMSFQRAHSGYPCPPGWKAGLDGWCVQAPPENEQIFYTDRAFIPKYQYWSGYAEPELPGGDPRRVSDQTDMRSINPMTGQYTVYFLPHESVGKTKYSKNPTADSYLAF